MDTRLSCRPPHRLGAAVATLSTALLFSGAAVAQSCPAPAAHTPMPNEVSAVPIPAGQVAAAVGRVDGIAQSLMASYGIPGMAVAVVADGKIVFAKGYGVRSLGKPGQVDADTVFHLASVSKPIGATVIARQVGKGVITWDTPLQRWLPDFQLADPYVGSHVTVGDMYAHRSGLPDHAGDLLEDLGYNREQMLYKLRYMPLARFRNSYAYTNFGLTAGAQAVAVASGREWAALSAEEIYRPLGMNSTSSRLEDFLKQTNRADGHLKVPGGFRVSPTQPHPDAQSPAGGVNSSVNDMARWMNMVLAQGCVDGKQLVDPEALRAAMSPQVVSGPPSSPSARTSFYGYGVNVIESASGRVVLNHSGAFNLGAGTAFTLIPSANVGIVALTNAQPVGVPEMLNAEFADLVQFGRVTQDWRGLYSRALAGLLAPQGSLVGKQPPASPAPARPLSEYVGTYENTFYGAASVTAEGDRLVLTLGPGRVRLPLSHWDGDLFTLAPPGESQAAGSISKASFNRGTLNIEYLDEEKLGTFCRADAQGCKP
ncbi:serine hydrolase [Herbaspirillum robiniae]|uniref:Serine hydrolase n=1 Tax=Herbaspirillum robiniae TaxID=2014887 RepID=A0ABX2M5L2_9BURK|nr:serine hydrolase [Herbaspirillum robiniae]NUU04645.1 serine hydrolase [Herbaspirillum robiniae]